jgi:hypothetical protein
MIVTGGQSRHITKRGHVLLVRTSHASVRCLILFLAVLAIMLVFWLGNTVRKDDSGSGMGVVAAMAVLVFLFICYFFRFSRTRLDTETMRFEWSRRWGFITRSVRRGFEEVAGFAWGHIQLEKNGRKVDTYSVYPIILGKRLLFTPTAEACAPEEAQLLVDTCMAMLAAPLGEELSRTPTKKDEAALRDRVAKECERLNRYVQELGGRPRYSLLCVTMTPRTSPLLSRHAPATMPLLPEV